MTYTSHSVSSSNIPKTALLSHGDVKVARHFIDVDCSVNATRVFLPSPQVFSTKETTKARQPLNYDSDSSGESTVFRAIFDMTVHTRKHHATSCYNVT